LHILGFTFYTLWQRSALLQGILEFLKGAKIAFSVKFRLIKISLLQPDNKRLTAAGTHRLPWNNNASHFNIDTVNISCILSRDHLLVAFLRIFARQKV
jgi:hypothetical protein